jgi:hypothetical protein
MLYNTLKKIIYGRSKSAQWDSLCRAVCNGHVSTVEALLNQNPAFFNKRNTKGNAIVHIAASNGHGGIIKMLLDKKADIINMRGAKGYTALHYAAQDGNTRIVELLIQYGVDTNIRGEDNKTALDVARESGQKGIVAVLEKGDAPEKLPHQKYNDLQHNILQQCESHHNELVIQQSEQSGLSVERKDPDITDMVCSLQNQASSSVQKKKREQPEIQSIRKYYSFTENINGNKITIKPDAVSEIVSNVESNDIAISHCNGQDIQQDKHGIKARIDLFQKMIDSSQKKEHWCTQKRENLNPKIRNVYQQFASVASGLSVSTELSEAGCSAKAVHSI